MPHRGDIKPRSTILSRPRLKGKKKPTEREIMKSVAEKLRKEQELEKNRKRSDKQQQDGKLERVIDALFRKSGKRKA